MRVVLQGLLDEGYDVDLYSSSGPGVLNKLNSSRGRLEFYKYRYVYSSHKVLTFLRFSFVQLKLFFCALRYSPKDNVVLYINTILPVGAALAARLRGVRVVYHYHENAYAKNGAYRFLAKVMQHWANRIVCVSRYQSGFLSRKEGVFVVPNVLSKTLSQSLKLHIEEGFERKEVLMLSSLKSYKGTEEFINLAALMPEFRFVLVLNDTQQHIDHYLRSVHLSENISVYPRQNKVAQFYNRASLVLNLSNKSKVIETFGLTALEAMTAGLPVLVPTVGGIAELVEDGVNGYKIDVADMEGLERTIRSILSNRELYVRLSQSAYAISLRYNQETMLREMRKVLNFS